MLSETQLNRFRNWKYQPENVRFLGEHFWKIGLSFIPSYVHPNLIGISGFLCVVYNYILTLRFQPNILLVLGSISLVGSYIFLGYLSTLHASKINYANSLWELFYYTLNNIAGIFMVMTYMNLWEIQDRTVILSTIFFIHIVYLNYHLESYLNSKKQLQITSYYEFIIIYIGLLIMSIFRNYFPTFLYDFLRYLPYTLSIIASGYLLLNLLISILTWHNDDQRVSFSEHEYVYSMFGLCLSYIIRSVGTIGSSDIGGQIGYLAEGVVLTIPTIEIILCKMSQKYFNPIVVVIMMASVVDNFLAIIITAGYYSYLFFNLSERLGIPLFRVKIRVYCSGVFDMCHRGHMLLFQRAAELGDELIVGVHSDKDVESYKRKPNVCQEERCDTVAVCKYVSLVIPNAPLILDMEFIKKHRIDLIVCSDEYDKEDDLYYDVPRKLGILKVLPRTSGVSSTDLMRIIMARVKKE